MSPHSRNLCSSITSRRTLLDTQAMRTSQAPSWLPPSTHQQLGTDRLIMDLYKHPEETKSFTFNNTLTGSTHRFESATYLGWFRCTSQKSDEPLGITSRTGESEITEFYFKKILG
ncbi:Interleukin-36 receptor antagonist protein [Chelonia mydas]|uniref:Interleukin-1 receptor antagonist protein n=1 Tax=Chelonia mydas TaxID=8469 RepID=M7BD03_CHEMY|nr:Interleukin-36 receptor antagonist protein [Chelonia mydas]